MSNGDSRLTRRGALLALGVGGILTVGGTLGMRTLTADERATELAVADNEDAFLKIETPESEEYDLRLTNQFAVDITITVEWDESVTLTDPEPDNGNDDENTFSRDLDMEEHVELTFEHDGDEEDEFGFTISCNSDTFHVETTEEIHIEAANDEENGNDDNNESADDADDS